MTWPEKTAIWSIILSTIALGWHIVSAVIDRPYVQVKCYEGVIVNATDKENPKNSTVLFLELEGLKDLETSGNVNVSILKEVIFVYTANRSHRPVTIVTWGIRYKEGGHFTCSPPAKAPFPHRLEEGEPYTLWVPKKSFIEGVKELGKTPTYAFIKTADNRVFKGRFPKIEELDK